MSLLPDPDFEKKSKYLHIKPNSYVSVPFAKSNGPTGSKRLNLYTLTLEIMADRLPRKGTVQSLLQVKNTDQDGRRVGDVFLHPNGAVSLSRTVTTASQVMNANKWAVVTLAVDNIEGRCAWYINGKPCDTSTDKDKLFRDGPMSIGSSGFGLLKSGNPREMQGGNVRRVYLHTAVLDAEQVLMVYKDTPQSKTKLDVKSQLIKLGYDVYGAQNAIQQCGENLQACIQQLHYMGYYPMR